MTSPGSDPGWSSERDADRDPNDREEVNRGGVGGWGEGVGIWATALSVCLPETEPGLSSVSNFDSSA